MKIKLTPQQIQKIVDDPIAAKDAKIETADPWWVIALKVAAYLIGLLLAGVGTAQAAVMLI